MNHYTEPITDLGYSDTGWGVILPTGADPAIRYALDPLLSLRREQAHELYRELQYRPWESPLVFFQRYGISPGPIDPERIPVNLLIVGDQKEIPQELERILKLNGHNLTRASFVDLEGYQRYATKQVEEERYSELIAAHDKPEPRQVGLLIEPLQKDLFRRLADHPSELYRLTPRQFEETIAAVLNQLGCDVELTPASRDGGRDIIAFFEGPFGDRLCAIVECKRYRRDRPVGIALVERFLWVLDREDKATCGLIATTSSFTPKALLAEKRFQWRLMLKDLAAIRSWLRMAGDFDFSKDGRLWLPRSIRRESRCT